MKQSLGTTVMLNFIIVFIVVTFAFLSATLSYMKAYKVSSRMTSIIEKYEGYNDLAIAEINDLLRTIGYANSDGRDCPEFNSYTRTYEGNSIRRTAPELYSNDTIAVSRRGELGITTTRPSYDYCIYEYPETTTNYYRYGIITYIHINLPVISKFVKVHIYNETGRIYDFHVIQ